MLALSLTGTNIFNRKGLNIRLNWLGITDLLISPFLLHWYILHLTSKCIDYLYLLCSTPRALQMCLQLNTNPTPEGVGFSHHNSNDIKKCKMISISNPLPLSFDVSSYLFQPSGQLYSKRWGRWWNMRSKQLFSLKETYRVEFFLIYAAEIMTRT
jgi:hypothetical protein